MSKSATHFEILEGYADDVLAIAAHGRITRADYETVLMPAFEEKLRAEGKVKMLVVFGKDFTGYSPGAAWDDAKFGFLHLGDFAGLAVVSDVEWLRLGVKALAPLISCPVALFHLEEMEAAREWINEWRHDAGGGPEVDAKGRLSTLDDTA